MLTRLNPSTLLSPVPAVMVSCCGTEESYLKDNIITVAWAGTVCSEPPMVSISVRPQRFSYRQIEQSGLFAVNLVGEELLRACDLCGVKSGREVDKFKLCGLEAIRFEEAPSLPVIASAPAALLCEVSHRLELGSHTQFIGKIISVRVQENLLDDTGHLHLEKAGLIAYSHGDYCRLGKKLGFFGYSVASPAALKRRMGGQ